MAVGAGGSASIRFRRTGGLFAGDRLETSVDFAELTQEEAADLEHALAEVNLDALARGSPLRGPGADLYQYDLTVQRGGETREVTVSETAVPDELRPLIDRLTRRAADERRAKRGR